MKRFLIIVNLLSIFGLSWSFGQNLGHVGMGTTHEEELVLEKVFFLHEKVEDVSVICHAPVNTIILSSQTHRENPIVSLNEINCEALKENSPSWPKEEAVGWNPDTHAGSLSEI